MPVRVLTMLIVVAGCGGNGNPAPAPSPSSPSSSQPAEVDPVAQQEDTEAAVAGPQAPSRDPNAPEPCPPESDWPEGMACVLGGTFTLGFADGRPDEQEPGEVYVDTFYMDLYEVTNARYEECIQAGVCERQMPFRRFMGDQQPAVAMSWFDAVHFCERHGQRLPTEAEWERAASGPEHTQYSWGDEPLGCERANVKDERGTGCGREVTMDVGSYPPGHFGLYDMTGNVHEWVQDFYTDCLRGCPQECGDACFGRNPRGVCDGEEVRCAPWGMRSVRGGSWYWPLERARTTARRGSGAPNRGPHRFGFRCARDLHPDETTGESDAGVESGE